MDSQNPYQSPTATPKPDFFSGERSLSWMLFQFTGRIPRRVFWGVGVSVNIIVYILVFGLSAIVPEDSPILLLLVLLYIPLIWISLAVQIKRWHDRDKSGWWVLINFIPFVGAIWAFIELGCLRGSEGSNQYGPDPT